MRKEPLTRKKIRTEIIRYALKQISSSLLNFVIVISCVAILLFLLLSFFSQLKHSHFSGIKNGIGIDSNTYIIFFVIKIVMAIVVIVSLICIISFFSMLTKSLAIIRYANSDKFNIITDKLIRYEQERYERNWHFGYKWIHKPYTLIFETYGAYPIITRKNYKWSGIYQMTDQKLFNNCNIGDEFYLVTMKDKILVVFNSVFFEL